MSGVAASHLGACLCGRGRLSARMAGRCGLRGFPLGAQEIRAVQAGVAGHGRDRIHQVQVSATSAHSHFLCSLRSSWCTWAARECTCTGADKMNLQIAHRRLRMWSRSDGLRIRCGRNGPWSGVRTILVGRVPGGLGLGGKRYQRAPGGRGVRAGREVSLASSSRRWPAVACCTLDCIPMGLCQSRGSLLGIRNRH